MATKKRKRLLPESGRTRKCTGLRCRRETLRINPDDAVADAGAVIVSALDRERHPDLCFAAANLDEEPDRCLAHLNDALRCCRLREISLRADCGQELYDRLAAKEEPRPAEGPLISIIVLAFNSADHIATAMEALIAQTWTNFEVLVVDDCSSDTTRDVVAAFSALDPRIRMIRAEANRGSYVARNMALRQALGEFCDHTRCR